MRTFSGGIHPPTYKTSTKDKKIRPARTPKKVVLALCQHTGRPSQPIVKPGDYVQVGAKVAERTGLISASLHSSVSGTVLAIEDAVHPLTGKFPSIIIDSDGQQKQSPSIKSQEDPFFHIDALSADKIIQLVSDAGIVGMGGAAFPTHVKLSPPKEKKIDTLIINAAECEPYLTCDHRLMLERADEVLKGAMIMCRALGVNYCLVGIEDNKPDAIEAIKSEIRNPMVRLRSPSALSEVEVPKFKINVVPVPTKYPQGAEKQLIKALLNREVPEGCLPLEVGVVVQNAATAAAVYEAVALNKPLYERVITVSGDCVKEPGNLLAKIGTPVRDLVEDCGGFVKEPVKVIFGGPMMGVAQWTLDAPVLKGTSAVIFFSRQASIIEKEEVCIRCGGCVRVCPVGIEPTNIYYAAANERFDLAKEYNACDCNECGACSFECPAKLDLAGMIKYAKLRIASIKKK